MSKETAPIEITKREQKLIELIRELQHGELRIIVQDTEPVRAESIKESIKF